MTMLVCLHLFFSTFSLIQKSYSKNQLVSAASSCYGYTDEGVMIAAASDAIWDNRAACGRVYKVTCSGPTNQGDPHPCRGSSTVVVKIVDYCPSGCQGTIDLSQEAFASIANPDAGKIKITYER